ncbi:MAG: hypothetical protein LBV44_01350 [Methylobacillus sp.]|jgi:hypothetical protein|nr:hypothetical protein [Methylobacillus sp.]
MTSFFCIADALPITLPQKRQPLRSLKKVVVCAASGDLPNAWCPQTVETRFISGKSPSGMCGWRWCRDAFIPAKAGIQDLMRHGKASGSPLSRG